MSLDPDGILSPDDKVNFLALLKEFDRVFDPTITGYNGAAGPIKGMVNMGPVQQPQHKGCMPSAVLLKAQLPSLPHWTASLLAAS